MKIVVVDTDSDLAALVGFALHQDGYQVVEINDPAETVPAVTREHPSIIVLAIQLARADGFNLCRTIRSLGAARLLIFNGPPSEDTEVDALDSGADVYLSQPLNVWMLRARVRALARALTV